MTTNDPTQELRERLAELEERLEQLERHVHGEHKPSFFDEGSIHPEMDDRSIAP